MAVAGSGGASDNKPPRPLSYGTVPDEAFTDKGIDVSKVPDLIEVADPSGSKVPVGYVRKQDLYPEAFNDGEDSAAVQELQIIPVYDQTGSELAGYVYANFGFVSLEQWNDPGFMREVAEQSTVSTFVEGPENTP